MRLAILSFAFLMLAGCAAAGGLKPSVMTNPPSYLKTFPLNTVTENKLVDQLGPPDSTFTIDGHKALVYTLGEGYGQRKFTYVIDHGVVVNVRYNDSGPDNGITAKHEQGK